MGSYTEEDIEDWSDSLIGITNLNLKDSEDLFIGVSSNIRSLTTNIILSLDSQKI
jgi:hypothetical protein